MRILSAQINGYLDRASWIRKMFETGTKLKQEFGEDAVCDFSLGNPDQAPPPVMADTLRELAEQATQPMAFGYLPNAGYPFAREALAQHLCSEQGVALEADDLIITCGAAGGINAFYRAVLEPGDEVICIAPYFVEYGFYAQNYGATLKPVPADPKDFSPDMQALEAAITDKTRVLLVNSPNNPTGAVYTREQMQALGEMLARKSEGRERPIFLLLDEPYRFLAFDGVEVPKALGMYEYTVLCSSFSKNLALAGERVGYVALNPVMPDKKSLIAGLILTNRIMGFVNAPAIGQRLMVKALGTQVNAEIYQERRDAMARVLDHAGLEYAMPKGAFYFFPRVPGGDDVAFCAALQKELILAVPGRGFGMEGFVRLAFCCDQAIIERSAEGFKRAVDAFKASL
ncbi:MAG: pyridoxal phosphate-dependent aminotransferase [Desulfovibrio sp.]|jgi:aspartate aminotransferase